MILDVCYTWDAVDRLAAKMALSMSQSPICNKRPLVVYPVPKAGINAALLLKAKLSVTLTDNPHAADVYVDDIVDSGNTRMRMFREFGPKPFFALHHRDPKTERWVHFPWDECASEAGPEDNVMRLLQFIGDDPQREGLLETPKRVVKSYGELFSGYDQDPAAILKVFKEDSCDEMVVLRDVEFFSTCEHHMLPFFGKAHIAYIPDGKVVGISKLARLLEVFSRRLQIQERLCEQVTAALDKHLHPKGSACVLEAKHLCMTARGVGKQNSVMVTSSLTGAFQDSHHTRSEFLSMVR